MFLGKLMRSAMVLISLKALSMARSELLMVRLFWYFELPNSSKLAAPVPCGGNRWCLTRTMWLTATMTLRCCWYYNTLTLLFLHHDMIYSLSTEVCRERLKRTDDEIYMWHWQTWVLLKKWESSDMFQMSQTAAPVLFRRLSPCWSWWLDLLHWAVGSGRLPLWMDL